MCDSRQPDDGAGSEPEPRVAMAVPDAQIAQRYDERDALRDALRQIAAAGLHVPRGPFMARPDDRHVHKPEYPSRCTGCEHLGWIER